MKFIIYSAPYDENIGGFIVLHKLCHLLNKTGHQAYLCPVGRKARLLMQMKRNPAFTTPLLPLGLDLNPRRTVTIYPEVVEGNPIHGIHVVRWLLYFPGFHTGSTRYGVGEFHVGFGLQIINSHQSPGNHVSKSPLTIWHTPTEHYNLTGAVPPESRTGVAYCVRKARLPRAGIAFGDAECIDGRSHAEIAAIFKRVKYFYSYDPFTYYSRLAALCGAISIVLPTPQMSSEQWYARGRAARYGVGFDYGDDEWSVSTRPQLTQWIAEQDREAEESVNRFARDVRQFFGASGIRVG